MFKASSKGGAGQFCAEIELLLCCARTCVDSKTAARVEVLLRQGVDLAYLIQEARHHGLLPLVYWNLQKVCPVPKAVLDQLRDYFRTNAVRNIILAEEMIEILKLLQAQNILAIPFKGPLLAALAYRNLALREFFDLDLWIHQRDFAAAQTVLESRGYRLEVQAPWESCFVRNDGKMAMEVDFHSGITPPDFPFALDFDHLCERLRHVELSTRIVPSFSSEDVLIILCVQVAKDAWESRNRLLQLCDIRAVIDSQPTIDWRNLMRQARTMGCQRMALLGFRLANELLEASVPTEILQEAAAHRGIESLCQRVRAVLFGAAATGFPSSFVARHHAIDRARDRVRHALWYFYFRKDRALGALSRSFSDHG
jgi:Uncharacterised nucleotidyltransferase